MLEDQKNEQTTKVQITVGEVEFKLSHRQKHE